MSVTVLQYHLKEKTIPQGVIIERLRLDRTTLNKWKLGILYPNRLNAELLIDLFEDHGVRIDFNDIYRIKPMEVAV